MKHYFETLGLKKDATQKEIQAAYERLSKELDPKNNDNQEFFKEQYEKVQQAYDALSQSSILKNSESSTSISKSSNRKEDTSGSNSSGSFTVTISKEKIEELKSKKLDSVQIDSLPGGLKTLCILSMLGSGLWALVYLAITISMKFGLGVTFLIFTIPFVLKFIGALKMLKGKKSGYKTYMITSIIFNVLLGFLILFGYQKQQLIFPILFVGSMIIFSIIFYNYKGYLR